MTIATPLDMQKGYRLLTLVDRHAYGGSGERRHEGAPKNLVAMLRLTRAEKMANPSGPLGLIEIELPTRNPKETITQRAICILTTIPPNSPQETYREMLVRVLKSPPGSKPNSRLERILNRVVDPDYVLCRLHEIHPGMARALPDTLMLVDRIQYPENNVRLHLLEAFRIGQDGQLLDSANTVFPPPIMDESAIGMGSVVIATPMSVIFFDQTKIVRAFSMNRRGSVPIAQPVKICLKPNEATLPGGPGLQLYLDACAFACKILKK